MHGLHGLQGCRAALHGLHGAAGAAQAAGPPPHSAVRVVACYHPRGRVAQAAQAFGEALNNGSAGGVIAEMGLNPTGLGVEPFLRALQAATPAAEGMETEAAAGGEKTGTEAPKPDAEKKDDSMDESKGP